MIAIVTTAYGRSGAAPACGGASVNPERTSRSKDKIMTSTARATANVANAQLSTGPRTEAGKAQSSRNAVSHGLASKQNFIFPGEEPAFAAMHDILLDQLAPADGVEMFQFELALHASWGMRRCRIMEKALMEIAIEQGGFEAMLEEPTARSLDRINRYAAHHQRSFDRALRNLRLMQTERLARRAAAGHQDPVPVTVPVAEIDKRTRRITKRTHPLVLVAGAAAASLVPAAAELQNEPNTAAELLRREVA
jgi:hypothetical protein